MSAGNTITLSDESHVSHEHESHEPHESHNLNHTGFDSCNTSLHGSDVPIRPLKKVRRQHSALERLKWWFSLTKAKQELVDPLFWHDVLTETILCVFFNTVVVWIGVTLNDTVYRPNILHFGLFAGFFAFLCIEGWSPICGSSLNVARTFAVFLCGKMTPIRSLVYFAVEIAGGAAGAMLAKSTTPTQYHDRFHAIMPAEGMTPFNACLVEGILTANLIVIQFVVTDPKLKPNSVMGSFPVGFAVATGIMAAGTHTGGLQNPVIAMTYAMVGNNFTLHWIYWVGSMTGSAIATAFYVLMEQLRERYGPYKKPTEEPENEEGVWENYPNNNNNTADGPRKRVAATSFWLEQLSAA